MERLFFAPYARAFAESYRYGAITLNERRGCVLRAERAGKLSYAEASPLAGHSAESLGEVLAYLRRSSLRSVSETELPSLRWALTCLSAAESFPHPVESNALLPWRGSEATGRLLASFARRGYRTFKLKIDESSWAEQVAFLADPAHAGYRFRLDANRGFRAEAAARFFARLSKLTPGLIDYVEEPLVDWEDPVLAASPVPLAADESAGDPRTWDSRYAPRVCLVKPTVQGSLAAPNPRAERIVVTSTLEAEPGRRALLTALAQSPAHEIAGLSTGYLLAPNYLPDEARVETRPPQSPVEEAWLGGLPWEELSA